MRALTGIPCPTCFLTRATSAALIGDLPGSLQLHAFGPVMAIVLVSWSVLAVRRRRFLPMKIRGSSLAWLTVSLVLYWLARMVLQFGMQLPAFPASG